MKRRHLDLLLGAMPVAWSLDALAQQPAMPVIGFLNGASPHSFAHLAAAFRDGLRDAGFIEGTHVAIEYRWADGRVDRLPELASDLVRRQVAVIVATGGDSSARSAKAATSTIPIVFSFGGDPVAAGLVASLGRPGGNLTGMRLFNVLLEAKRLELLRQAVPSAATIAYLVNPGGPEVQALVKDVEDGARRLSVRIVVLQAKDEGEFEAAFASLVQQHADALVVGNSPYFNSRRDRLVALAARHKVPAIYEFREFAAAGGLLSYGTSLTEIYRQIGVYAARILKGARPAELPVLQPTKFELVINLKTAKALGLTIPQTVLLRADEVIE